MASNRRRSRGNRQSCILAGDVAEAQPCCRTLDGIKTLTYSSFAHYPATFLCQVGDENRTIRMCEACSSVFFSHRSECPLIRSLVEPVVLRLPPVLETVGERGGEAEVSTCTSRISRSKRLDRSSSKLCETCILPNIR